MIPIDYDLLISSACVAAGILMLCHIGAFSKNRYTSALASISICVGLIAWLIIALVSLSAVLESPPWMIIVGWTGSWGYTASRVFMGIMWMLMLLHIELYSPKCEQEVKAEL